MGTEVLMRNEMFDSIVDFIEEHPGFVLHHVSSEQKEDGEMKFVATVISKAETWKKIKHSLEDHYGWKTEADLEEAALISFVAPLDPVNISAFQEVIADYEDEM